MDFLPRLRNTPLIVLCDLTDNLRKIFFMQVRFRSDLRKSVCNFLETVKIVFHVEQRLRCFRIVDGLVFQKLYPAKHARYWCSKLMCCLTRHSHPDIALFASFNVAEADIADENKEYSDCKFDIGKPAELNDKIDSP